MIRYLLFIVAFVSSLFANIPPYTYDGVGNITRIETPTQTITKTYDALNRLKTVTDSQGTTSYEYDAIGRQTQVTYPNGVSTSYSYDSRNRVTKIEHTNSNSDILQSFTYTYDEVGNRLSETRNDNRTINYEYNEVNQLIKATITNDPNGNNTVTSYAYDAVGNLISKTVEGIEHTYTYDANDRLISKDGTTLSYDANGNLIDDGTNTYEWDDKNRLVKVTTPSQTIEYSYDGEDNRIAKVTSGGTTAYLIDANTPYVQVITESKANGTEIHYTYGNDLVGDGTHYFLTDVLGSTRGLVDSDEELTDSYDYKPYGELLAHSGISDNDFLFTGEQFDSETSNYYLRARYYNVGLGRFVSRDSYDGRDFEPATLNHYLYANANPLTYTDPSGHCGMIASVTASAGITDIISSQRGVKLTFQIYGEKGIIKQLSCGAGVSYIKRQYRIDGTSYGLHGHHPISRNLGGAQNQELIFLPAHTHEMFHWVLDLFLKIDPSLKGYGNWTSSNQWESISETREGRKAMYKAIYLSSYVVDKVCKLKGRRSLRWYVKKYKKDFIGGSWQ